MFIDLFFSDKFYKYTMLICPTNCLENYDLIWCLSATQNFGHD